MNSCVNIHRSLPFAAVPGTADTGFSPQHNLQFLNYLLLQGEFESLHEDAEAHRRWRHLESRIDIALLMLSHILIRDQEFPAAQEVTLSEEGLAWVADAPLALHADYSALLYPEPQLPLSLRLPLRIRHCQACSGGYQIQSVFHGLDTVTADLFARYVFVQHRRDVAQHRGDH